MQPDSPVDYTALHRCPECEAKHRLIAYPVDGGWIVAAVCDCREKGLPRRYSTESETLQTFDAAENRILDLLNPSSRPHVPNAKNVYWDSSKNLWTVQFKRGGNKITVGNFVDRSRAIEERDKWLAA